MVWEYQGPLWGLGISPEPRVLEWVSVSEAAGGVGCWREREVQASH